jgi:hypothetical protein
MEKVVMEGGTVKVWFQGTSTSRNIHNVDTINMENDMAIIRTKEDNHYYINMRNVNLIEEV